MTDKDVDPNFEFDAPKFHDFNATSDGEDSFFNHEHSSSEPTNQDANTSNIMSDTDDTDTAAVAAMEAEVEAAVVVDTSTEDNVDETAEAEASMNEVTEQATDNASVGEPTSEVMQDTPKSEEPADENVEDESLAPAEAPALEMPGMPGAMPLSNVLGVAAAWSKEANRRGKPVTSTPRRTSPRTSTAKAAETNSASRFHPYSRRPSSATSDKTPTRLSTGASRVRPKSAVSRSASKLPANPLRTPINIRKRRSPEPSSKPEATATPRLTKPRSPKFATSSRVRRSASVTATPSPMSMRPKTATKAWASKRKVSPPSRRVSPKLTRPTTPKFQTELRVKPADGKTTEEIRLAQAENEVEAIIKRRKIAADKLKMILQPSAISVPARSVKALTSPQEFRLRTTSRTRHRSSGAVTRSMSQESLGGYESESGASCSDGEYQPLGDRLRAFSACPDRYRSQPRSARKTPSPKASPRALTSPKEFKFRSDMRARRSVHVKSQAEREEEEMADCKKKQFKALKLNPRILDSSGALGVPRVAKASLTQPAEFSFRTSLRADMRSQASDSESDCESTYSFKAKPAPNFRSSVMPKSAKKMDAPAALTAPVSPKLRTRTRSSMRTSMVSESMSSESIGSTASAKFRARPMPTFERTFVPQVADKPLTTPKPFKLRTDEKAKIWEAEREARIAAEEKERKQGFNFKAKPIVEHYHEPVTPQGSQHKLTNPKPFKLQSDLRHEMSESMRQAKIQQEAEEEKKRFSSFKAQPAKSLHVKPWTPEASRAPLTEVKGFDFNVDRRNSTRATFEAAKAEREAQIRASKQAADAEAKAREQQELSEMRKNMVVKANPIRSYRSTEGAKRSTQPLTEPKSPQFRSDARANLRMHAR